MPGWIFVSKTRYNLDLVFANIFFGANFSFYVSLTRNYLDFQQIFMLQVLSGAIFFIPFALFSKQSFRIRWRDAGNILVVSQAQRKAALSQFNPQLNMYFSGGWATATPNLGYDVSFNPIVGVNLNIPIFRWGARFKTNRQQKAYIGIQKLQQSYMTDNINEELSAALTKLTETESQVKTAKENMSLANENLDLATFSYNEGKASMVDVLSAQLSWTQAHTNLINAYLAEKMAVAEYKKVTSE